MNISAKIKIKQTQNAGIVEEYILIKGNAQQKERTVMHVGNPIISPKCAGPGKENPMKARKWILLRESRWAPRR